MTLSNIFFGKRVVQQAYLNNALIYQSKGWETLPSTCTEAWTKSYLMSSGLYNLTSDLDNNIYAVSDTSLYKLNSEAEILWQKDFSNEELHDPYYIQINNTTNSVFVLRVGSRNNFKCYIDEFSLDGSLKNEYDIKAIANIGFNSVQAYVVDDRYIYISVYYYDYSNYIYGNKYLVKIDMIEKKAVQIANTDYINSGCLVSCGKYLYAAIDQGPINPDSGMYLVKFNKEDLSHYALINTWVDVSDSFNEIKAITTDKLGNIIYKTRGNGTFKYNVDSKDKVKLPVFIRNVNNSIHLDYKQNIYIIEGISDDGSTNGTPESASLLKISSDNTLIYRIPLTDNLSPSFTVDYQGNIYYCWYSSGQTYIKKLINIEKKGN